MWKISLLSVLVLLLFAIPVQSQKIFKVQYESQADIKVYIVKYESQAGWRNQDKLHLLRVPK